MKVLAIRIENHKVLTAFEYDLGGKNLAVVGKAGVGKTTIISALWSIIEKVGDAVTHGAKKGLVRVVLGDGAGKRVIAERRYTAKTSTTSIVMAADGKETTISVKDFEAWYNKLGVNPHRLMEQKPQARTATLLGALDLPEGVNLEEMDRQRADLIERRKSAKEHEMYLAGKIGEEPESVETIDVSEQMDELKRRQEHNRQMGEAEIQVQANAARMHEIDSKIEILQAERARLVAENAEIEGNLEGATKLDTVEIEQRIHEAAELNAKATEREKWEQANHEHDAALQGWEKLDKAVKNLDAQRKQIVADAKWPLPGLGVQDGEIVYNGMLLSNLGASEQMLVCGAIVAASFKPDQLRVVRMDGTESMSKEDFLRLEEIFSQYDIQVLSSRVSRGDVEDYELVIEPGETVAKDGWGW